eukprot:m.448517 g.448517  ORF g.448517 m.448517 type:complete len:345 (+) comp20315_c14_seq41:5865-6899(+)
MFISASRQTHFQVATCQTADTQPLEISRLIARAKDPLFAEHDTLLTNTLAALNNTTTTMAASGTASSTATTGGPAQGSANMKYYNPTAEELAVLKECQDAASLRGSIAAGLGGVFAYGLLHRARLQGRAQGVGWTIAGYGSLVLTGFYLGVVSYGTTCKNKLLQLENSPLGDRIRAARTAQVPTSVTVQPNALPTETNGAVESMAERRARKEAARLQRHQQVKTDGFQGVDGFEGGPDDEHHLHVHPSQQTTHDSFGETLGRPEPTTVGDTLEKDWQPHHHHSQQHQEQQQQQQESLPAADPMFRDPGQPAAQQDSLVADSSTPQDGAQKKGSVTWADIRRQNR